jgi:hypothetical protein
MQFLTVYFFLCRLKRKPMMELQIVHLILEVSAVTNKNCDKKV